MMDNDHNPSKYWRGLVTGVMIGAGTALLLAQRTRQEKAADQAIDEAVADAMNDDMMKDGDAIGDEVMDKDALDKTLDSARQAAREMKDNPTGSWNQTLEEAKTSKTGIEDLSKSSTNDN